MLAKTHRFHGHNSLTPVYQKGQTVRSQFCAARFAVNKRGSYRIAVVVSKKVAKSAPTRNRIRRRIYEVVRNNASEYLGTFDIIITVFDERLATIDHEELEDIIIKLLEQIKPTTN